MKVGHSRQGGVWTRLGVYLKIEVLGGNSPARQKHWRSTHLQHVQDLSFTAQMPVLGAGEEGADKGGSKHCGGFHTPFLLSLGCTRGWGRGGCCPVRAAVLSPWCL